jgi:threonine dehydratase
MELEARLARIDVPAAARRLAGVVRSTRLLPFDAGDARVDLRLKLECEQETGSFKARGAWNNLAQLTAAERRAGVIATSSGNHGKALAWAARRAGVRATIVMPADAYPNKVQACRDEGAEVLLAPTRAEAEALCAERVSAGQVLIHPYDADRTVEGAGTAALEVAEEWADFEVLVVPVGGGGLIAGSALALKRRPGPRPAVVGVEPAGAATLSAGTQAGRPVILQEIQSKVQGLCPLYAGELNVAVALEYVDWVVTLEDEEIFDAQKELVRAGHTVEPAGAAGFAAVRGRHLPPELHEGRSANAPLRVAVLVSGGNPDPAQLASLRRA